MPPPADGLREAGVGQFEYDDVQLAQDRTGAITEAFM